MKHIVLFLLYVCVVLFFDSICKTAIQAVCGSGVSCAGILGLSVRSENTSSEKGRTNLREALVPIEEVWMNMAFWAMGRGWSVTTRSTIRSVADGVLVLN